MSLSLAERDAEVLSTADSREKTTLSHVHAAAWFAARQAGAAAPWPGRTTLAPRAPRPARTAAAPRRATPPPRLAVVPMMLEARGLDVTPGMIETFSRAGLADAEAGLPPDF